MKIHDVEQNSEAWHKLRLGIPTASEFDRIITSTGAASKQVDGYLNKLLAEFITKKQVITFERTGWMDRGNELEDEAAKSFEIQKNLIVTKAGFCTNDEGTIGASADRFVGEDYLLEIKVPAPNTHVEYMLKDEKIDMGYYPQIQGQLYVTGKKGCYWMSYNEDMPSVIIFVPRNEIYIESMHRALVSFNTRLEERRQVLIKKGYINA